MADANKRRSGGNKSSAAHSRAAHSRPAAPRAREVKGPSEASLRKQMCQIGHRLWLRGLCGGNEGNLSCRVTADRVLCTPTKISKGFMKPDDLCIVGLDGIQISGVRKITSEIFMHLFIYRNRADTRAVVHSHPPHATAFAVAGIDLPTCIHPEPEVFLGQVKTAPYTTPGDLRLGESVAPFIQEYNTALLANHGVVCWSDDLEDAYYKMEIVDAYARVLILARQLGNIQTLDSEQMRELLKCKPRYGQTDARVAADGTITGLQSAGNFVKNVEIRNREG